MSGKVITIGCTVKLKSGGPYMTVVQIIGAKYYCTWFFDGSYHSQYFSDNILKIISNE